MNIIEKLRKERGLHQQDVAEAIGVPQTTYSRWERGTSLPKRERLLQLASFYGVSVDSILNSELPVANPLTKIPVLGTVAAGIPIFAEENIVEWEYIPSKLASTGEFFALAVMGESMSPHIAPGDILIIKQTPIVNSGSVAIVLVNGDEATCKKVYYRENGIELVAYNKDVYQNRLYNRKEVMTLPVKVIGQVVEVRKSNLP